MWPARLVLSVIAICALVDAQNCGLTCVNGGGEQPLHMATIQPPPTSTTILPGPVPLLMRAIELDPDLCRYRAPLLFYGDCCGCVGVWESVCDWHICGIDKSADH
jgi:hypothetical protein